MNKYKKLPHIDLIDNYQFVTFRTKDSIDNYIKRLNEQTISNKSKQQQIDEYLDASSKGCYLNNAVIKILREFFITQKNNYDLAAFCIMPNHIHILFKQTKDLAQTVKHLKGASSALVNKTLSNTGSLWAKGYYDKVIRDNKHFIKTYEYIKHNPIKANLADYQHRFYGIYEDEDNRKGDFK